MTKQFDKLAAWFQSNKSLAYNFILLPAGLANLLVFFKHLMYADLSAATSFGICSNFMMFTLITCQHLNDYKEYNTFIVYYSAMFLSCFVFLGIHIYMTLVGV